MLSSCSVQGENLLQEKSCTVLTQDFHAQREKDDHLLIQDVCIL